MFKSIDKPLITTIIPTYRRPKLLRRAILSVLRQTYPNFLVCVYDNASGDDTKAVVEHMMEKDNRVRYHCHSENVGPCNNFNFGIKHVTTPYFSLLSDDDIFAPAFFEKAVYALQKHPAAMFVCMPTIAVDLDLNVVSGPVSVADEKNYESGEGLAGMVDGSIPAKWSGILFRKEVRDGIGVIDTEAGPYADAGYVFHAAARFQFVVAPGIAAVYVIHENTTSGTIKPLDGTWPGWWDHMVTAIADDPLVPMFARKNIRNMIYPDFRKRAVCQTLRFLGEGNPKLAKQSADGVSECGHNLTSQMLNMMLWTYSHSGIVRYILTRIKQRRKTATKKRMSELNAKFGHDVEFIKSIDQSHSGSL